MAIKVLVVDDSALVRSLLAEIIRATPGLELVGLAPDAFVARDMVKQFSPDVITLDIEMPRMDGLSFLEKLMNARPTPVVMISTLTEEGADATLRALELGAVDFIPKPKLGIASGIREYTDLIVEKIQEAAVAKVKAPVKKNVTALKTEQKIATGGRLQSTEKIIAIGASTGGTEAIKELLMQLPAAVPGIVMTQHMPPGFTRTFAERLDKLTRLHVVEAKGGERILPGHAYLAPGGHHLIVVRSGADYVVKLSDAEPVHRHRPAVDVMMESVALAGGKNVLGVLLTGMGKDGAKGMLNIREHGGYTLAQDEASCVVYGMPKEAVSVGGVDQTVELGTMGAVLLEKIKAMGSGNRL
ncbi:chemotaxis response regulator protein-glutamate methylesterase [Cellvibrio mixtus]|uniref:Protein-glutamate methylesterase/protein-glutamine glutaminase n=1 Tax=Cellvibrio mixtus TaxID=39650 RepID=A0A266Q8K8_9GAMM|nr:MULTISPECIES: chemotaxis response regulator protein-glutamate methylesterase [Cellvibrio]AQT60147.1 chemotaxis response regulator protein-glutamate methylesterase [Cellvibrio sp. PSBB023]OZY86188.1 chemotaxis response regulator protein-glutamate methylesterase [Cellvibrio mixtus]